MNGWEWKDDGDGDWEGNEEGMPKFRTWLCCH